MANQINDLPLLAPATTGVSPSPGEAGWNGLANGLRGRPRHRAWGVLEAPTDRPDAQRAVTRQDLLDDRELPAMVAAKTAELLVRLASPEGGPKLPNARA